VGKRVSGRVGKVPNAWGQVRNSASRIGCPRGVISRRGDISPHLWAEFCMSSRLSSTNHEFSDSLLEAIKATLVPTSSSLTAFACKESYSVLVQSIVNYFLGHQNFPSSRLLLHSMLVGLGGLTQHCLGWPCDHPILHTYSKALISIVTPCSLRGRYIYFEGPPSYTVWLLKFVRAIVDDPSPQLGHVPLPPLVNTTTW
jgi:hypothetical protein